MSKIYFDNAIEELGVEQILNDVPIISGVIGRFHILSATYHNLIATSGSSSGVLATYDRGVFSILTGTNTLANNLISTAIEAEYLTIEGGMAPSFLGSGLDMNLTNIINIGSLSGSGLFSTNGSIQNLIVRDLTVQKPKRALSFFMC